MAELVALQLVKEKLGLRNSVRETYITAIIDGVNSELEDQGLVIDLTNPSQLMFVVDYSAWRYKNTSGEKMPRDLQFRLHNLIIKQGVATRDI